MKSRIKSLFFVTMLSISFASVSKEFWCDADEAHPIDIEFEKALDESGGVTVDIRNAQSEAYGKWNEELDRFYVRLYALLDKDNAKLLKKTQIAWEKFEKAEEDLVWAITGIFYEGGTAGPVMVSSHFLELTRQRACDLSQFVQQLEEVKGIKK